LRAASQCSDLEWMHSLPGFSFPNAARHAARYRPSLPLFALKRDRPWFGSNRTPLIGRKFAAAAPRQPQGPAAEGLQSQVFSPRHL